MTSARIDLEGAQSALASAIEQRDATIAGSEQAVENAQVALENARADYETAVTQAGLSNAAAQVAVDKALNDVAAAKANQAATEDVGTHVNGQRQGLR